MTRQILGVLGCVALVAAGALTAAIVFFDAEIADAGFSYHFVSYSLLALVLFGFAGLCGLCARSTRTGTLGAYGTLGLGLLFVGYVAVVLLAY
jgi:hypothetical protein